MSTPREHRATARDERRNLQLPEVAFGRAAIIRSRTPSPVAPGNFIFPPAPELVVNDQFHDAEIANNEVIMGDPDTIRALTEALQGMKASSRKPELPDFDPKNVEIWVKRVDNAYRRAGITDAKDKFAHIESKFSVDADSRIQSFIFGDGTDDEWADFIKYLKERYGRTKSQQASVILDGVKRDGRLPSEMFAFIKEKIGTLTIDDLIKEMVTRELPTDIQRTIHESTKSLDGAAAMKVADNFFDKDGRPIHRAASAPVNNVEPCPNPIDTDEETDDVNAVGRHRQKGRPFRPRGQSKHPNSRTPWAPKPGQQQRPQGGNQQGKASFTPAFAEKKENRGPPTVKNVKLCKFHQQYGDAARTCESSCIMYGKWSGNGKAGRQA